MYTLNSERYINLILNRFFPEFTEEERLYGYFQQDSATVHTAGNSMAAISDGFCNRDNSEGLWPAHSTDLMLCDFYLWGSLNDKVYKRKPHTTHKPEENIKEEISRISPAELHVNLRVFSCNACLQAQGEHFQHLL
jgi:hypothetical protein